MDDLFKLVIIPLVKRFFVETPIKTSAFFAAFWRPPMMFSGFVSVASSCLWIGRDERFGDNIPLLSRTIIFFSF